MFDSWCFADFRSRKVLAVFIAVIVIAAFLMVKVTVELTGNIEGLYILEGEEEFAYQITDDVFPEDMQSVVVGVDFEELYDYLNSKVPYGLTPPYLDFEWSEEVGRGYINSYFPQGEQLLITFSRYRDGNGLVPSGLFLGGGERYIEKENQGNPGDSTGMAFFDGERWNHVWCTANEGIFSAKAPENHFAPVNWKHLGSKVIKYGKKDITLSSRHEVVLEGVPLRIDRYVSYRAGDTFILLLNRVTNAGDSSVRYFYTYGDEPWVGRYGSSEGDVGWVKDHIINYESSVDTSRYSFAGFFDYGNEVIGEGHGYSKTANFIEWLGENKPDQVYFSNAGNYRHNTGEKVPLSSEQNRVIVLEWNPRALLPGQSDLYVMGIGLAQLDPATGFPVKPRIPQEQIRNLIESSGNNWQ